MALGGVVGIGGGVKKRASDVALAVLRYTPQLRVATRRAYWWVRAWRYRALAHKVPVDSKLVFFEAYGGRSFACSPKALYEQMLSDPRFSAYRFVWSFREGCVPAGFPGGAHGEAQDDGAHGGAPDGDVSEALFRTQVVLRESKEYFHVLAQAKTLILNTRLPEYVTPKSDQVFVQCWHGTPLKRLGYDVAKQAGGALNTSSELAWRFGLDMRKWSYLLSPSPYTSKHLADAFGLPHKQRDAVIIEEGYPRNDALARGRGDEHMRASLRQKLGIPHGKKVVLYAPTWRDDAYKAGVGYTFDCMLDLKQLRNEIADEWVVLFRAHYYIANQLNFDELDGFVIDVSALDNINDAYLAADVLLTDYSSTMFDYAILKRPIVLHVPDADHYQNDVRGFYFPLSEVPAPLCETTEEVARALCDLGAYEARYGKAYQAFVETFAPHDDGNAAKRVLEKVFFA